MRLSAVMISSTMPSAKYSCSGSPLILAKGSTAIDGFSGRARAGGSAAPTRAPRVKPAGFGSLRALPSPACAGLSGENLSEGFPAKFGSNDADFTLSPRRCMDRGDSGRVFGDMVDAFYRHLWPVGEGLGCRGRR